MKLSNSLRGSSALCGALLFATVAVPTMSWAEDVTLRSQDGSIDITGEFIDFVDNLYLIRTELGDLRLSAERVSCEGAVCPVFDSSEADVTFAGSDTVGSGVMPLLLEGYAGYLNADSEITVTGAGSEVVANFIGDGGFGDDLGTYSVNLSSSRSAFNSLLQSQAEVGMSSRRIRPEEARALRDAGAGNMVSPDQEHIVAIDSIVVITHPDNPVRRIKMDDLAAIYNGQITNWSQIGGPDLPIEVISRGEDDGAQVVFVERVLGGNAPRISNATIASDNTEMASLVNQSLGTIGYTGFSFQRGAKAVTLVNECGIGMTPDAFSARTEEYALQRRLYLYNRTDSDESTKAFLDFAKSPSADEVIIKAGFIDLGVDRRAQSTDSDRALQLQSAQVDAFEGEYVREMLATMENYDRLSTTFRFRTGSSKLDERAVVDMERLVSYIEELGGTANLKVVGFTDEVGPFESNLILAQGRADQVMAELAAFGGDRLAGVEMSTAAFGEIAPSACNASDVGRSINRRVEIWIENAG